MRVRKKGTIRYRVPSHEGRFDRNSKVSKLKGQQCARSKTLDLKKARYRKCKCLSEGEGRGR